jgi:polyhydroxyalkanoate synthesis repressor PhaR
MSNSRKSAASGGESTKRTADGVRVLKKYPNRRLYDTLTSSYITLADVKDMVMAHEQFVVRDAKSGDDLTRSILLQIILDEESGGAPVFSEQMLAQIIRFYGHTLQGMLGGYLEKNLQAFVDLQGRFSEQAAKGFSPESWAQLMNLKNPVMQGFMNSYLEQSQAIVAQMQEQMQKQASGFFNGVPGFPPKA